MEISELSSVEKQNNKEFKNKNLKFVIIINNWQIVAEEQQFSNIFWLQAVS
jgi:hypothetical protein